MAQQLRPGELYQDCIPDADRRWPVDCQRRRQIPLNSLILLEEPRWRRGVLFVAAVTAATDRGKISAQLDG
jgi:hypothetical protein